MQPFQSQTTADVRSSDHARMASAAGIVATASVINPYVALGDPDVYMPYRMSGEWTLEMIIQYFALTGIMTLFCFVVYLIFTKLRII